MSVAFDTNVVVAGLLSWHEHHAAARPVLAEALASNAVVLPAPALIEAWAVMTRLPAPWRVSGADAHLLLERTFEGRSRVVALDGDQVWGLLDDVRRQGVAGGSTYDAQILACARLGGASRLVTFNRRHFERLDLAGVTLVVPST